MSDPTPADPDTHVVRVTREPRPDGGAVYHVTVDAGSEAVIAAGCLIGTCHRHAPRREGTRGKGGTRWPRTMADEWCGEFELVTTPPQGD